MRKSKGRSCWSTLGLVRNYAVGLTVAKPVNLSRFAVMKSASAPVMQAWGFTTQDYRVPAPAELSTLLAHVDYT